MASIKKNFVYNVSITLAQYLAGLIVFPYVSRCLGVELMGKNSYATNIVAYFTLFALLGAVTVGTREIAICRGDFKKRSQVFSNIMIIILTLTSISLLAMTTSIFLIPKFADYKVLLLIGSFSLFFTSVQIEWLYQGIEKFDYIAKRSVFVRILYCISVFVFIHDETDYVIYYVLTTGATVVNGAINLIYSRNYVHFSLKNIEINKYLRSVATYGVNKVLISMYTTFNVLFLGLVCTNIEVGYYSTANKLFIILLGVISSFTYVILPRMSSLLADNKMEEFRHKISQSFDIILSIAIPISICGVILAPQIIRLLAGEGYEGAIIPMQIIMPVLILTGSAQVCIMQVLIPMKKDKVVLRVSVVGAVVAITANILFVEKMGAIGTALVLLLSELVSDIYCFYYAINHKIISFPYKKLLTHLLWGIPYVILCYAVTIIRLPNYLSILMVDLLLCIIYFFIQNVFICKNNVVGQMMRQTLHIK